MCICLIFINQANLIFVSPIVFAPHDNELSLLPCSWLEALVYLNFLISNINRFGLTVELYISRIHSKNCLPFYGIYFSQVRYRIICENCNATKY